MESFLQSQSWLSFQKHIGRRVFEYNQGGISAGIIEHDLPYVNKKYLYIPHGPLFVNDDEKKIENFINYLKTISNEGKYIFIKVEPLSEKISQLLREFDFKICGREIQPTKTQILNLEKNEEELLSKMHHKTRYNIRVAEKHSITFTEKNDIISFWNLLKKTSVRDKFHTHVESYYHELVDYFKNNDEIKIKVFIAEYKSKPAASALVLIYKNTGYYIHGAMDYDMRSYMAPFMLHWQIIRFLKSNNLKNYDFWGVDEKNWPGVTKFKKGWGGKEVKRPGSFDFPIHIIWYWLYSIARKIL